MHIRKHDRTILGEYGAEVKQHLPCPEDSSWQTAVVPAQSENECALAFARFIALLWSKRGA
jgi:hypothetical protein